MPSARLREHEIRSMDRRTDMPINSAISARFSRLRLLISALPLCLLAAGCGNSISGGGGTSTTTAVSVVVSASPTSIAASGTTTLTAVVTNSSGAAFVAPSGQVTFLANSGTTLGTATPQAGCANSYCSTYILTEPGSSLPAASNVITASFAGDQYHQAAVSTNSVTVTVTGTTGTVATTSTLTAKPTSINVGQTTTLTATVTAASGTTAPTGPVSFVDQTNGITIQSVQLTAGTSGTTSTAAIAAPSSSLATGANSIVAVYQATASFGASTSTPVTVTLSSGSGGTTGSTTNLLANPSSITSTESTSLTATVAASSGTTTPTGTVEFYNETDSQQIGGLVTLTAGSTAGTATATLSASGSSLVSGGNTIIAEYSGDTTYAASTSASVTVTVSGSGTSGIATTTSVAPNTLTLAYGGACVSVSITVAGPPTNSSETPTGVVDISADGLPLGSPNMGGYNGTSSTGWTFCADNGTPLGAAGNYSVLVSYPGDSNYAASSVTLPVTVTGTAKAQTTVDLSATSASTIPLGSSGSVQATVVITAEPNSDPPTGTVTFYVNGTTLLGTATVGPNGGAFTANLNFPTGSGDPIDATGTYTVNAVYGGDANYNASSTSNGVTFVVN